MLFNGRYAYVGSALLSSRTQFRTTFLPRGRFGGRVPVHVAGADWLSKREGAEQVIRSKHLSRESKQYYEHEQEYQKHVHLLTCLVYSRVKGSQQLNSQAPVIRVGVDDVHNSGQIIVNSDINRNVSAFIVDDGDMYTILQWACSFLNSFSFATDH